MVLIDGTIVELGGDHLDAPATISSASIVGSEGQLGIVTEATVRILRAAEGARPMLIGFDSAEDAGACVAAIIASRHHPGRDRIHGPARRSRSARPSPMPATRSTSRRC